MLWIVAANGVLLGVALAFLLLRYLGLHLCPEDPEHPPRAFPVGELSEEDEDLRNEIEGL